MRQKKAEKTYVMAKDVQFLLGVGRDKSYAIIRDVNAYATEQGYMAYTPGRANKYLFAKRYGIPQETVNAAVNADM